MGANPLGVSLEGDAGGIASLIQLDEQTSGALTADLMRIGASLDTAHRLGWHNVIAFARHAAMDSGSYLWHALNPEYNSFNSQLKTAAILADLYDAVRQLHASLVTKSGQQVKMPKPYPRPWVKDEKRIGKGAIPVKDFDLWYYGGE